MGEPAAGDDGRAVYTPADLAERWSVTATTVRQLIRSGELEAFRVGSKLWRVRAEALAEYEARKAKRAAGPTPEEREAERRWGERLECAIMAVMIAEGERRRRKAHA